MDYTRLAEHFHQSSRSYQRSHFQSRRCYAARGNVSGLSTHHRYRQIEHYAQGRHETECEVAERGTERTEDQSRRSIHSWSRRKLDSSDRFRYWPKLRDAWQFNLAKWVAIQAGDSRNDAREYGQCERLCT